MAVRNVTITLDEELARWARVRAAERDMSMSRLIAELLHERMRAEQSYEVAMRDYLAQPARQLRKTATRYPRRADLHAR